MNDLTGEHGVTPEQIMQGAQSNLRT